MTIQATEHHIIPCLGKSRQLLLGIVSFFIVAFGQPAWVWWFGLLAAAFGYALFWRVLLDYPSAKQRFLLSWAWFTGVQMVQGSWMTAHPYFYIYIIFSIFSAYLGLQFGLLGILIRPRQFMRPLRLISLAALWALLEWSRLFFFSGYTWNPAGIALTGSLYSLQLASIWGIFGLSFWVIYCNLLAVRAWMQFPAKASAAAWLCAVALPYAFGAVHFHYHDALIAKQLDKRPSYFTALLVQPAFPAEEAIEFKDKQSYIAYVFEEWRQIVKIVKPHLGQEIDLIALPEYVVPLGTYTYVYPAEEVKNSFASLLGKEVIKSLPPLEEPFAQQYMTSRGKTWFVNNAYWAQSVANVFQAEVIAGLEDVEEDDKGLRKYFSAAVHFRPNTLPHEHIPDRYSKRVLLPMAEYIPFSFCQSIAAGYGISGSFTKGESAKIWSTGKVPFGVSICYEETFGDLMRENKLNGAELLVNLTNDGWYPHSKLPQSHLDHARLRTVESGIPLIRACNTGVTCGLDSLGRVIARLGEEGQDSESLAGSLLVKVPTYHYNTLYAKTGDLLFVGLCIIAGALFWRPHRKF